MQSKAWKEVKKQLKVHLNEVKKTAGQVRAGTPPVSLMKAWEALFTATKTTVAATAKASKKGVTTAQTTTPTIDKSKFEERTIRLRDGRSITIAAIQELALSTKEPWTHMFDDTKNELVIYYNTNSLLYKQYAAAYKSSPGTDQTKMLSAWATFDSLFIVLTKPGGHFEIGIAEAMEYRSEWLCVVFEETNKTKVTTPKKMPEKKKGKKAQKDQSKKGVSSKGDLVEKIILERKLSVESGLKKAGITKTRVEDCSDDELIKTLQYFRKNKKSEVES